MVFGAAFDDALHLRHTAAFRAGEAPLDRLSRLMDYRLIAAPPGAPCPRDALRVCRLLDLDEEWMKIFG